MAADLYADYVIVGAGSAGCVLAARLTESGAHKVVLLEAGGDDRPLKEPGQFISNVMIHTPIGFGKTLNDPKVNWLYETEVDPGSGNRKHKWPKGKVLGGSSSINGMLYVRGQAADYDNWAQMGARGWSWDEHSRAGAREAGSLSILREEPAFRSAPGRGPFRTAGVIPAVRRNARKCHRCCLTEPAGTGNARQF